MNFKLLSIENPSPRMDDRSEGESDHETYRTIHAIEQQPMTTGKETMRSKKTAECPKCNKLMSKKTLEYSHKCSIPKPTPKVIPHPTEESIYEYIMEKERSNREQHREKKREQLNKMMSNAF